MSDLGMQDGSQQLMSRTSMLSSSLLNINPRNQLIQARDILELGLQNVSFARQAVALTDGKSIADISWAKVRWPICLKKNYHFVYTKIVSQSSAATENSCCFFV